MSLLNKISSDTTLNKKVTEELFIRIFDVIKDLIINREEVLIDNFGSFRVERRKIQTMIDYNRKVVVLLPPKDKIIFRYTNGSIRESTPAGKAAVFSSRKIVNIISETSGVGEIAVYEFFNILFEVLREYLEGKRNINIIEFGKFKVNRNNKISFSPAKKFSDKVNYNFNNLKARIIRSLNRDEIKKLYRERLRYSEDTELQPEEITEVEEQLTVGKEEDTIIKIEKPIERKPAKKEFIPPQVAKDSSLETADIFEDKGKPEFDETDKELQLKEKIESDFRIIEEMFKEKEAPEKTEEINKETDLDILLMQDTEEAVEPVITKEPPAKIIPPVPEIVPPAVEEAPPVITETAGAPVRTEEKPPAEHKYYIPTEDSPATEKIISDFEEKVKSFLKQADEERKSYEKELDKIKPPGKEITLSDMTGISEPPVEEIIERTKPETSFVSVLDKIVKDDEDEIEIAEIKAEKDFIIPEKLTDVPKSIIKEDEIESAGLTGLKDTVILPGPDIMPPDKIKIEETIEDFVNFGKLKDIPESVIKEDEIESAGITGLKDTVILPGPVAVPPAEVVISEPEEQEENIPISEVYKKLKDSFMEETEEKFTKEPEKTEPVVSEKPEETIIPEIEKSSFILQQEKNSVSEEIREAVFKDLNLPEPEIKLPEPEIKLPEPEIPSISPPVIKFPDVPKNFKLKDDDSYKEELSYEDKKKEFEKLMQKYSDEFKTEGITGKDIEESKSKEIIPPVSKPSDQKPELPFKPFADDVIQTEKDDTLDDLKSYIDKIGEKKSSQSETKVSEDDALPFKKVEDIDLPKSIDDYFEEIEEEFKKRKQNKNKDKQ